MTNVTLIPGDGIGPEIAASLVDIFKAANVSIKFDIENAGIDIYNKTGSLIPDSLYESIEKNKIAIKGLVPYSI